MSQVQQKLSAALADRYEIGEQIGEGGMATVFLARDLKHKRDVAFKVLRPELCASIGTERFDQEIEIAARLQHPHILPVYDSGDTDDVLYYVMPFVEGESLKERIARGALEPADALRIAREVASALDYAHRQGVVHRDIKPANILLSQGHAVVADFGIARAVSGSDTGQLTQVGMAVGTPWYMSPEQATADPNVDARTDIYALGCVLYEMLEGKPPFNGETAQAVIAQTISAPVPDLPHVAPKLPAAVPAAVRKALAKDPAQRFATAGEFAAALDVNTGELAVAPRSPRSAAAWVAAAAVVVAAVVFVFRGTGPAGASVAAGADVIAVLPFEASGTDEELGEGMVSLLSTNLNAIGAVRTVEARTVLQRWRRRGGEDGLDFNQSLEVARDVNAGSVLLGSVVAAGTGVRLTAELFTVEGEELARVQVDGHADDVLMLVDSLSLGILHAIWRSSEPMPSFDVAAVTSGSLEAVRAYMRGGMYMRHGQWDSAVTAFEEAVSVDSTFAMANLALAEGYGWTGRNESPAQAAAVASAQRFSDRLPARERLLVIAHHLHQQNDPAALDSIRTYTTRYPGDPRGWYALGDFQYHGHGGPPHSPAEYLEPFERAIALDSSMVMALVHPMEIAITIGDRDRFRTYRDLTQAAGGSDRGYSVVEQVLWGADEASRRNAIDSALGLRRTDLSLIIGVAAQLEGDLLPYFLDTIDSASAGDPSLTTTFQYILAMASLATGQFERASRHVERMEASDATVSRDLGAVIRLLSVLGGIADPSYADPALEHFAQNDSPVAVRYMAGIGALIRGDPARAREAIGTDPGVFGASRHRARGILGWASLLEGDTASAIAHFRTALDSAESGMGNGQLNNTYRYLLGRLLARNPETYEEGIRWLRYGFPYSTGPEMRAAALLAAAEEMEAAGDIEGAIVVYSDFIELWSNADPALQPRVEVARQAIARLRAERN